MDWLINWSKSVDEDIVPRMPGAGTENAGVENAGVVWKAVYENKIGPTL